MFGPVYDSTQANACPEDGVAYLGYLDGLYRSYDAMVARFGADKIRGITVMGDSNALVIDREPGNLSASDAASNADTRLKLGKPTIIYTDLSGWPAVVKALSETGVPLYEPKDWPKPGAYWWAGDPTGEDHQLEAGEVVSRSYNGFSTNYTILTEPIGVQWGWKRVYDVSSFKVNILSDAIVNQPSPPPVDPTPPPVDPTLETTVDKPVESVDSSGNSAGVPVDHGPVTLPAPIIHAVANGVGGYYFLGADGTVYLRGPGSHFGDIPSDIKSGKMTEDWFDKVGPAVALIVEDSSGYAVATAKGAVYPFGSFRNEGAI